MAKKAFGSSQKGAAYERTVALLLSLWVSDGVREDVFWRTAMSGGRSTVAMARGKRLLSQAGDIGANGKEGEWFAHKAFLIEAKRYQAFDWARDIHEPMSAVAKKKTQRPLEIGLHTKDEAEKYERYAPLCFLRANHAPDILMTTHKGADLLSCGGKYPLGVSATFPSIGASGDLLCVRLDLVVPHIPYVEVLKYGKSQGLN